MLQTPVRATSRTTRRTTSRRRAAAAATLALATALPLAALAGSAGARVAPAYDRGGPAASSVPAAQALAPAYDRDTARRDSERGTRFRPAASGSVSGLRYFRVRGDTGRHVARVWSADGTSLRRLMIPASSSTGWQKARFKKPVTVRAGAVYTASFSVRAGVPYAVSDDATAGGGSRYAVLGGARGSRGELPATLLPGSQHLVRPLLGAAPTTSPTSFPDASSTGVPDGARLAPYTGPRVVRTAGTVIDGRQVDGSLSIQAQGVVIKNTMVNGTVEVTQAGSVTISDTTVDGGTYDGSAVGQYNLTLRRVEVVGARQSVSCNQGCDVQDSWLHGQFMPDGSDWHGDGFVSNGGRDMLVRHNTLSCDSTTSGNGGCSGAVALFADFDPIDDVTIDGNLFTAGPAAYCLYGGFDPAKQYGAGPTGVVITGNVFERGGNRKCAAFGPVTAVPGSGGGNVFEGNVWDDGKKVRRP